MIPRLQNKIKLNVQAQAETGCWLWTGQISNSGHGRLMIKGENNQTQMLSAEHVSYIAFIGPPKDDEYAKQSCNNRLCVNPEHLVAQKQTNL